MKKGTDAFFAPAAPGLGDDHAVARRVEVRQQYAVVEVMHERTGRNGDEQVLPGLAVHFLAHARLAALGVPMVSAHEVQKRVLVRVGDEDDVAAASAVTAVGAALGNELLATKGDAPGAAVTGWPACR